MGSHHIGVAEHSVDIAIARTVDDAEHTVDCQHQEVGSVVDDGLVPTFLNEVEEDV